MCMKKSFLWEENCAFVSFFSCRFFKCGVARVGWESHKLAQLEMLESEVCELGRRSDRLFGSNKPERWTLEMLLMDSPQKIAT